jgi:prephenate dehydratase
MQHVDLYTSETDAAYQGAPGAYSEEAARVLLGDSARLMPCASLEQTFETVADGRARHAVVPVEDAHSGTVPQVYDLLLGHDLRVTGEVTLNVDHVLVARPGTTRRDIRRVMSHPIALAQCADFFRQNRHLEAVSVFDTAGAVRMLVERDDPTTAAIASHRAADLYGAQVLAEHIQDFRDNWTRFLLLAGRGDEAAADAQKALVAFALPHEPGALVNALRAIAEHGLSITKIEGRPVAETGPRTPGMRRAAAPFEYRFVVEMIAPRGTIPPALYEDLRRPTTWLKSLGAYRL